MSVTRRAFLRQLGVAAGTGPYLASGLIARAQNPRLRHASIGCANMALSDLRAFGQQKSVEIVALCDVDLNCAQEARRLFPGARFYQDWRKLLEAEQKHLDSVNVSTPDHMHAPIAATAMNLGKHVYVQKPLAHELQEARALADIARRRRVVTQMGIQVQSASCYRTAVRIVQDGLIGKIREVHSWCSYNSWGDIEPLPKRTDPVPSGFDWDLWLGVREKRPYLGDSYYHPGFWRRRLEFGSGTLGDMGCHILDPVFKSLGLTAPVSVRSEGPAPNAWNWAPDGDILFEFPGTARTAAAELPVTWRDTKVKMPLEILSLLEGDPAPAAGSIFVGTDGVMLLPHFTEPVLYPKARFRSRRVTALEDLNHWAQFVDAAQGKGETTADFSYAGPLTETILIGCAASRYPGQTLKWNQKELRFNDAEVNALVRRDYRQGWSVDGLS